MAKQLVDSLSSIAYKIKFVCQMIRMLQNESSFLFYHLGPLSLLWAPPSTNSIPFNALLGQVRIIHVGGPHIPLAAINKVKLPIVPKFYV